MNFRFSKVLVICLQYGPNCDKKKWNYLDNPAALKGLSLRPRSLSCFTTLLMEKVPHSMICTTQEKQGRHICMHTWACVGNLSRQMPIIIAVELPTAGYPHAVVGARRFLGSTDGQWTTALVVIIVDGIKRAHAVKAAHINGGKIREQCFARLILLVDCMKKRPALTVGGTCWHLKHGIRSSCLTG